MNKPLILSLSAIVLLSLISLKIYFGLAGGVDKNSANRDNHPAADPSAGSVRTAAVNFSETGNLTNFNGLMEKETAVWSLVYEKPGKPALRVELKFDSESLCNQSPCNMTEFKNGDRVKIEGVQTGDKVLVTGLSR